MLECIGHRKPIFDWNCMTSPGVKQSKSLKTEIRYSFFFSKKFVIRHCHSDTLAKNILIDDLVLGGISKEGGWGRLFGWYSETGTQAHQG